MSHSVEVALPNNELALRYGNPTSLSDTASGLTTTLDPQAEEFIYEALTYSTHLLNLARRFQLSFSDAQDLVQETYLKALRYYRQYQKGSNLKAWLSRILVNTFYNFYHKTIKHYPLSLDHEVGENKLALHKYSPSAEDEAIGETLSPEMLRALDTLSLEQREVIFLVDLEEFSYREVSQLLDIPTGTVMSRVNRGRGKLKRELLNSGYPH